MIEYRRVLIVLPPFTLAKIQQGDVIKWKHFLVNDPLWGESSGHRWIPLTKTGDADIWCFLWSAPEQTVEQTIDMLVIWDAIALIMMSLQWRMSHGPPTSVKYGVAFVHLFYFAMFWFDSKQFILCLWDMRPRNAWLKCNYIWDVKNRMI